jgi:hypothetical protein
MRSQAYWNNYDLRYVALSGGAYFRSGLMSRVVLVVDDEPLVLEVTAAMLEDIGCEVITAPDGKNACECFPATGGLKF